MVVVVVERPIGATVAAVEAAKEDAAAVVVPGNPPKLNPDVAVVLLAPVEDVKPSEIPDVAVVVPGRESPPSAGAAAVVVAVAVVEAGAVPKPNPAAGGADGLVVKDEAGVAAAVLAGKDADPPKENPADAVVVAAVLPRLRPALGVPRAPNETGLAASEDGADVNCRPDGVVVLAAVEAPSDPKENPVLGVAEV